MSRPLNPAAALAFEARRAELRRFFLPTARRETSTEHQASILAGYMAADTMRDPVKGPGLVAAVVLDSLAAVADLVRQSERQREMGAVKARRAA
jgi:hypothetical protein